MTIKTYDVSEPRITPDAVAVKPLPHHEAGLSYTASGYGTRIPTTKVVKVGSRWHRVYVRQFSNAGTAYIIKDRRERLLTTEVL